MKYGCIWQLYFSGSELPILYVPRHARAYITCQDSPTSLFLLVLSNVCNALLLDKRSDKAEHHSLDRTSYCTVIYLKKVKGTSKHLHLVDCNRFKLETGRDSEQKLVTIFPIHIPMPKIQASFSNICFFFSLSVPTTNYSSFHLCDAWSSILMNFQCF